MLDQNGRYIIMKCTIQGEGIYLVNLYAPNTRREQSIFYTHLHDEIVSANISLTDILITGGDWNTILAADIDKMGGNDLGEQTTTPEMRNMITDLNLHDIWRIRNPTTKRFTYRQKRPLVQTRLDYFLLSHCTLDIVTDTKILSSFCSDHSCISIHVSSITEQTRGSGHWKFNSSLLKDETYVNDMKQKLGEWSNVYDYCVDKRIKWELLKYEVRKFTIAYSKLKKQNETYEVNSLQQKLNDIEIKLGNISVIKGSDIDNSNNIDNVNNNSENLVRQYERCKNRLNEIEEQKAEGVIIRSKAKWVEKGDVVLLVFLIIPQSTSFMSVFVY